MTEFFWIAADRQLPDSRFLCTAMKTKFVALHRNAFFVLVLITLYHFALNAQAQMSNPAPPTPLPRADFNEDVRSDIIWEHTSGARAIWLMNDTTLSRSVSLGTVDSSWEIKGSGDFNGDSKPDILWQNSASGQRAIWLMNGVTRTSSVYFATISTQWDIAGAGDFNGDGNDDILWQNTVTGARAIWLMNGTTYSGTTVSLGMVDTVWEIVGAGGFGGIGERGHPLAKHRNRATRALAYERDRQEEFRLFCHGLDRRGHRRHGRFQQ